MEVLISMFVLTVGLLGVAALIPAGRHEIVEATKLDNASMVGRAAFRDMQVRGYMNPNNWYNQPSPPTGSVAYMPNSPPHQVFRIRDSVGGTALSDQAAYCIDPLGRTAQVGDYGTEFPVRLPTDPASNTPRLGRIVPFAGASDAQARGAYDTIFRSSFDLVTKPNATNEDFPSVPQWFQAGGSNARRMSEGNYSWLATIVSDQSRPAVSSDVTVSVAIFYKRVLAWAPPGPGLADSPVGEYVARVYSYGTLPPLTSGGSLEVTNLPTDASGKIKLLRPGQWIMLAGSKMTTGPTPVRRNYYRWYKVLSAANLDTTTNAQNITIAGQDWSCAAGDTQVWIFDNIVNVYEKQLPLELTRL